MEDERGQKRYKRILKREHVKYDIPELVEQLVATLFFPPTSEQIKDIEAINTLYMRAQKKALQGCNKVYTS
eukprot:9989432-Ditylum_brightwellii.AAC.1